MMNDNEFKDVNTTVSQSVTADELRQLRQSFQQKHKADLCRYDVRDVDRFNVDDAFACRFLRHQRGVKDKAVSMVHDCLVWRKDIQLNDLTEASFSDKLLRLNAIYYRGHTRNGNSVLIFEADKLARDLELVQEFVAWTINQSFQEESEICVILDTERVSVKQIDIEMIKFFINCFAKYFPAFLSQMLVYEMPWLLNAVWQVVRKILTEQQQKRVEFVKKKDLTRYIDEKNLIERMGGQVEESVCELRHRKTTNSSPPVTPESSITTKEPNTFVGTIAKITPADQFIFNVTDETLETLDTLTMTNITVFPLAFKVKTTSPDSYRVRPSAGFIPPGQTQYVSIFLQAGCYATIPKDKFLVMIRTLDEYYSQETDIWRNPPLDKDKYMERRLVCTMTVLCCIPPDLPDRPMVVSDPPTPRLEDIHEQPRMYSPSPRPQTPKHSPRPPRTPDLKLQSLLGSQRRLESKMFRLFAFQLAIGLILLVLATVFVLAFIVEWSPNDQPNRECGQVVPQGL